MKKYEITGTTIFLIGVLVGIILTFILLFCSTTYFGVGTASIFRSITPKSTIIAPAKTLSVSPINPIGKVSDPDPVGW